MDTKIKGWIAVDVDGTLTAQVDTIPLEVVRYLHSLSLEGWQILVITGRALSYFHPAMHLFSFPYYLAIQNGADILKMPERTLITRKYMTIDDLRDIERLHLSDEDMILYSGFEHGDFCYFRPHKFSKELLDHLEHLKKYSHKPWREIESFDFEAGTAFPLIKCFGKEETIRKIEQELNRLPNLHASTIRDPVKKKHHFNLVTHRHSTKGQALRAITGHTTKPIIAAGDDRNDLSMFAEATVKVVMETAPPDVLAVADIIAPSAARHGVIDGLKQALARVT
jgi:Cof subfamily protein (haloacid dehalogenase superfamily)